MIEGSVNASFSCRPGIVERLIWWQLLSIIAELLPGALLIVEDLYEYSVAGLGCG